MKKSDIIKIIREELNSLLSETIKKVGNKYVVYPKKGGKRLGTHNTYQKALNQLRAIERSKHMKEETFNKIEFTPKEEEMISMVKHNKMDIADLPDDLMTKIFDFFGPKIPYGILKAKTGDPYDWVLNHIDELPLVYHTDNGDKFKEKNK
jgi:hypothetical protein